MFFAKKILNKCIEIDMLLFMKNPLNKLQKIPEISPIAAVVQVPWIVKTDDDMVNNILKMGALVKAVEHQRLV